MKTTVKNFKIIVAVAVLIAVIALGFKTENASKSPGKQISLNAQRESFTGTSEFYFKPAGDQRLWHVVNVYSSKPLKDSDFCNNSIYTFSKDSVEVINSYLVTAENGSLNFDFIGDDISANVNNFNK